MTAKAHEASLRLQLSKYELVPGDSVLVSGTNLLTDGVVEISLVAEATHTAVSLGEALCDGNGSFLQTFTLPTELSSGVYTLQAIDHSIASRPTMMASATFRILHDDSWLPIAVGLASIGLIVAGLARFYRPPRGGVVVKRPFRS